MLRYSRQFVPKSVVGAGLNNIIECSNGGRAYDNSLEYNARGDEDVFQGPQCHFQAC